MQEKYKPSEDEIQKLENTIKELGPEEKSQAEQDAFEAGRHKSSGRTPIETYEKAIKHKYEIIKNMIESLDVHVNDLININLCDGKKLINKGFGELSDHELTTQELSEEDEPTHIEMFNLNQIASIELSPDGEQKRQTTLNVVREAVMEDAEYVAKDLNKKRSLWQKHVTGKGKVAAIDILHEEAKKEDKRR